MLADGRRVYVARRPAARLVGLALLREPPPRPLLIPDCSSVHTFGMRFPIDIEFLDAAGETLGIRRAVQHGRVVSHRGAAAVLETPSPSSRSARSRAPCG
jgi:uncharacterized protein